jgi:hypothetical protein
MLGNLHVRFGVGAGAKLPGLHHIVEDRHATPAEVARVRIDFANWLKTLSRRSRRVAELLAIGHRAVEVARRFHVSRARVSQLRWELHHSWQAFVGEPAAA